MPITQHCPLCKNKNNSLIYSAKEIPIFQNKVYPSAELANQVPTADVTLARCTQCGFVYNSTFDPELMHYDSQYENEQAHSMHFQDHLHSVTELFYQEQFLGKKMIEIGCGKGFFLEKLICSGFDVTGFDPAYTGNNPKIIKDYFSQNYSNLSADVIILRHVLEHIQYPLDFLHTIAEAVNYQAKIYIEVPTFDWIIEQNAFWDIFYEHCNYFTLATLGGLFTESHQGLLFNGQYMFLIADLDKLRNNCNVSQTLTSSFSKFAECIDQYKKHIRLKPDLLLWGAGAKGITFANLVDPEKNLVSHLIDINPKKQDHYIAKTAHKIISPAQLDKIPAKNIIVMNDNYFDEIKAIIGTRKIDLFKLDTF